MDKQFKKKILTILLTVIVLLGLFGCSTQVSEGNELEEMIQGKWVFTNNHDGVSGKGIYIFDEGDVSLQAVIGGLELTPNVGTYEIVDSKIKITFDNGTEQSLKCVYKEEGFAIGKVENDETTLLYKEKSYEEIEMVVSASIYEYLQSCYEYGEWDLPSTTYETGSITVSYDGRSYEVKGILYLYDKYGEFANKARYSVNVNVSAYGKADARIQEVEILW